MLDFLKKETRELHHEIEASSLAKYILDHSISVECYKRFLLQNYCSYVTIEQELVRNQNLVKVELRPYISNKKSEGLHLDLTSLGESIDSYDTNAPSFSIHSETEAIGALYVLEGSMLGSMVISKNLAKCPKLEEIETYSFFGNESKDVVNRWRTYCSHIDHRTFSNEDKTNALMTARRVFQIFGYYNQLFTN
ncbi:MAG: biliverdin-producing heme oxygenase [Saonia sp.]